MFEGHGLLISALHVISNLRTYLQNLSGSEQEGQNYLIEQNRIDQGPNSHKTNLLFFPRRYGADVIPL